MKAPSFVDEVVVHARAGDGGDGAVAWRREKFVPRGGPAGGDGGDGGDVVFVADAQKRSLLDFKYRPHLTAKNGEKGRSKNQFGARGDDAIVHVPVGTQVFDADTGELLCDLAADGQREIICGGGSGGHGNTRFVTASRQAPDFAKPGLPGELRSVRLSLKLLADVGLLGFPNAGKSTLLSTISAARPKVANYPFTTLTPQLGVVRVSDDHSFVMADIPGLIEGAAEGAGLGVKFLKHLERVSLLCHLIEAPHPSLWEQHRHELEEGESLTLKRYEALRRELAAFSEDLTWLPEVVVVTKVDLLEEGQDALTHPDVAPLADQLRDRGVPLLSLSSVTAKGTDPLRFALHERVQRESAPKPKGKEPFDPLAGEKLR